MQNELIEKKFDLAIANMKLDILKDIKEHLFLDKDRYVPYNDDDVLENILDATKNKTLDTDLLESLYYHGYDNNFLTLEETLELGEEMGYISSIKDFPKFDIISFNEKGKEILLYSNKIDEKDLEKENFEYLKSIIEKAKGKEFLDNFNFDDINSYLEIKDKNIQIVYPYNDETYNFYNSRNEYEIYLEVDDYLLDVKEEIKSEYFSPHLEEMEKEVKKLINKDFTSPEGFIPKEKLDKLEEKLIENDEKAKIELNKELKKAKEKNKDIFYDLINDNLDKIFSSPKEVILGTGYDIRNNFNVNDLTDEELEDKVNEITDYLLPSVAEQVLKDLKEEIETFIKYDEDTIQNIKKVDIETLKIDIENNIKEKEDKLKVISKEKNFDREF